MRLYNMYFICKSKLEFILSYNPVLINPDASLSNKIFKLDNWKVFVEELEKLSSIVALKDSVIKIYDCIPTFLKSSETVEINSTIEKNFGLAKSSLCDKMVAIIELYESMGYKSTGDGFDIKLPTFDDLDELSTYIKEINFIITQCPYLKNDKEVVKFRCMDVGSTWVSFLIAASGTTIILSNLAKIVDYAVKIKSHIVNVEMQEEQLKSMKISNDAIKEVVDGYKKVNKDVVQSVVANLESELGELNDGDERGRLEKSLEKFAWMLDKGMEIHTSINNSIEVKDMFPTQNEVVRLEEKQTMMLENKQGNIDTKS